jgi:hypothetical protein
VPRIISVYICCVVYICVVLCISVLSCVYLCCLVYICVVLCICVLSCVYLCCIVYSWVTHSIPLFTLSSPFLAHLCVITFRMSCTSEVKVKDSSVAVCRPTQHVSLLSQPHCMGDMFRQRFSNFFQVGTTFISRNVLRTPLLLSALSTACQSNCGKIYIYIYHIISCLCMYFLYWRCKSVKV